MDVWIKKGCIYLKKNCHMKCIVYGIPNCDVTKKALKWLDEHDVPYDFFNYKLQEVSTDQLKSWCQQKGWEILLNKRGTTFKALHVAIQQNATNEKAAIDIMAARSSTIKRPVIEINNKVVVVGFDEKKYEIAFL